MINREITYERDINRSYMKIPSMPEDCFDERLLLKKQVKGLLPIEKCYVAGVGQYWYNITGCQALDAYCRVNSISNTFFENLILRFCQQVELLEWNLIDVNCLVADPELIFVNHSGEEIGFVAYPFHTGDLFMELQQLIEYLLTKLDHKDSSAVSLAYQLYEMTLSERFSVSDLKKHILDKRMERTVVEPQEVVRIVQEEKTMKTDLVMEKEETDFVSKALQFLDDKLTLLYEKVGKILERPITPEIVYPKEKEEDISQVEIHPTVCIVSGCLEPKGELICERKGTFPDFQLEKSVAILGKNPKVQLYVDRETISQFHARIEYHEDGYYIEDLNSTNGTYVNGALLSYKEKRRLEAGDNLKFADIKYHFY